MYIRAQLHLVWNVYKTSVDKGYKSELSTEHTEFKSFILHVVYFLSIYISEFCIASRYLQDFIQKRFMYLRQALDILHVNCPSTMWHVNNLLRHLQKPQIVKQASSLL